MGHKNGKRVRKIEVLTDTHTECELRATVADIQRRRDEREAREMKEEAQKKREEARKEETTHSAEKGVAEKHASRDRSDTEMKKRGGRRGRHISITLKAQEGTHDKHLPD